MKKLCNFDEIFTVPQSYEDMIIYQISSQWDDSVAFYSIL